MRCRPTPIGSRWIDLDPVCPLCESRIYDGEPCPGCFMPFKVLESIGSREQLPRFVGVLGPSGVGKTVYLGMLLDLLARGMGELRGLSRSPYSMTVHRELILALERQRYPEKTPLEVDRWHWLHCEVTPPRGRHVFDIITPDVAGEAVFQELENPGSSRIIRGIIGRCAGLMVLLDMVDVVSEGRAQELFAMQLITYLDAMRPPARKGRKLDVPLAIIFSKADLFEEEVEDASRFARGNVPALFSQCESRVERYAFFCSGVAGASARLRSRDGGENLVPLRVEPRGIVEPLGWMIGQFR